MNWKNIAAAVACFAIFAASFALAGGVAVFWNLAAFLAVFSGLAAAILLSYPMDRIRTAFMVAKNAYTMQPTPQEDIVRSLLDVAVRSKMDGLDCLEQVSEKTTVTFLKNALMLLVDNYREDEIRDFLRTEMSFFNLRRQQCERIFLSMARLAPAFGVAGSVIGLIGLLMGLDDTAVIREHIPVAFVSTLYGIVLANLVFVPAAENIHFQTKNELLNQKLIMEGIVAIAKEQNPYKLEKKLTSFLSPSQREGQTEALRTITRKYISQKNAPPSPTREKDRLLRELPLAHAS